MPVLKNPKHEAFAQRLAKGENQDKAYAAVGYKANRAHASRLASNGNVQARVAELQAVAAKKTTDAISWEAKDIFERLQSLVDRAAAAGAYKDAIDGQKFIARCFGYEDSPTLTHEHVKNTRIQIDKPAPDEGGEREEPRTEAGNVTHLVDAINKLRKRAS